MQKITVTGPPDLLAILPYQLGFHPQRSVVVVGFRARLIELVARLDALPDPADAARAAASLAAAMRREALTDAMIIGYEDEPGESTPVSEALAAAVALEHITLMDRIVVRDGRWSGLMCTCCRDEPIPQPADVGAVADFVALGRTPLGSRDDLAALITPASTASDALVSSIDAWLGCAETGTEPDLAGPERLRLGLDGAAGWHELCLAAWAALLHGDDEDLPQPRLALLLASLRDRALRDGLIAVLCPGSLPEPAIEPDLVRLLRRHLGPLPEDRPALAGVGPGDGLDGSGPWDDPQDRVRSRLQRLCRLAPTSHAAPMLTVAAVHAWWDGGGALARIAVEQALELEPDHVLAGLLQRMLDLGIRSGRPAA